MIIRDGVFECFSSLSQSCRYNERMTEFNRFTLEKHDGPYETWPLRSRLLLDGEPTNLSLPGYTLLFQFEAAEAYILITDYDCPYEEITNFALVSKRPLRLLSCRWLGWMYETFILERIEWIDQRTFIAVIGGSDHCWRLSIRSWGIPYIRPRLKLNWLVNARREYPGKAEQGLCEVRKN